MNKILIVLLNIILLPDVVLASTINYDNVCNNSGVGNVMIIVGNIINVVKWIVPLIIIVLGMIDFGKAVISSDEKAVSKATISLVRRIVAGVVVFFVPTLIGACTKLLLEFDILGEGNQFATCTNCMFNTTECEETVRLLEEQEEAIKNQEKEEYESEKDKSDQNDADINSIISSSSITLTSEYKTDADLRYMLYTPSSATSTRKTPLIVWLHGSGEQNASETLFKNRGLPSVLNNWTLDGFNAYVLCPISTGSWKGNRQQVYDLIEKIVAEKNINTNKIILVGHSMGGIGVQTIANGNASYFSALVILSGYNAGVDLEQFKSLPVRAYAGSISGGEDSSSYNFTTGKFTNVFGKDNAYILNTSHGNLPNKAFNLDENSDNKSDLVEWMLKQ